MIMVVMPIMIPVMVPVMAVVMLVMCAVARFVDLVIPAVLYKINGTAASVIFRAVSFPMSRLFRRDIKINRLIPNGCRPLNDDRLRVNDAGLGDGTDIDDAVCTWLCDAD